MSEKPVRLLEHMRKNIKDAEYGVILTYTFDPDFFENSILPLINENLSTILVFMDENEYYHLLKNKQLKLAGRKYYLIPTSLSGIFHPKLAMFIPKKYVHLYIGSMNMTTTGFLTNLEALYYVKFPNGEVDHVLMQVWEFLQEIRNHNLLLRESRIIKNALDEIFDKIEELIGTSHKTKNSASSIKFIHNLHNSILNEVTNLLDFRPTEIHVLGPFYGDFSSVKTLIQKFPGMKIYVYLQNGEFSGKIESLGRNRNVHFMNITSEEGRYIHAKLLAFSNTNDSIIYVGSANPTVAGILKSVKEGGNLEIGIVHKIDAKTLKALVTTLNPSPLRINELKSKPTSESSYPKKPVISGIVELLNNNTLRLILKGASDIIDNLKFSVGEKKYSKNSPNVKIEKRDDKIMIVVIENIDVSSDKLRKNNSITIKCPQKELLKIPITIEPAENDRKLPIEDKLIVNTILDESFRFNIEKILARIERILLTNKKITERTFRIPTLSIPYKKTSRYEQYSTLKLLEKLIDKLWELKAQYDKLIFLEDIENAKSTLEEFMDSLLKTYPYFSEYSRKAILEKIKNINSEDIPSIIEVPPRRSLSILGQTIKVIIQDEHIPITIKTSDKELMSIFEVVKENDKAFLKIKDKNKLQKKATQVYKNHYDKLVFNSEKSMRALLYHLFKNADSFLHLNLLFSIEENGIELMEEINIFKKELVEKILALYILVKVLDPKFIKYHDPPLGILRTVKLLYPELLYTINNEPITENLRGEITDILESLRESGLDTPSITHEDIETLFTNLAMETRSRESWRS